MAKSHLMHQKFFDANGGVDESRTKTALNSCVLAVESLEYPS
jgi:hypothetical protein